MADTRRISQLTDAMRRIGSAMSHVLARTANSLQRLSSTMWLALCLVGLGVVVLVTSTAMGVADSRTASLSAAALCTAGMGATLWSFARSEPNQVERSAHRTMLPATVAHDRRSIATPLTPFLMRPAQRTDPLFRLGMGAIVMMLVGFVQPLLLVMVTVFGAVALYAARRVLARGTLVVLGTMLAIPPAGLLVGSLLAPLLGIQLGLMLLLVPVAMVLLGSTAARQLSIAVERNAIVLSKGMMARGIGLVGVVGLSLAVLAAGRITPDAGFFKPVDAQAQARPSDAAGNISGVATPVQSSTKEESTSMTSTTSPLMPDWRPSLIANTPDINLLLVLALVAAVVIGRFGISGITGKLRAELARCANSPRGMAAVGLIGLAALVLGEAQFGVQPAAGLKSVGTGGGRERSLDRESLMGRIKTAQIRVDQFQAIRTAAAVGAAPDVPRQPIRTDVEFAEAEAELATLRLQLARLDLQAAKTGSTPIGTVDLSTWGRADPQPAP